MSVVNFWGAFLRFAQKPGYPLQLRVCKSILLIPLLSLARLRGVAAILDKSGWKNSLWLSLARLRGVAAILDKNGWKNSLWLSLARLRVVAAILNKSGWKNSLWLSLARLRGVAAILNKKGWKNSLWLSLALAACGGRLPYIEKLDPQIGVTGEYLVIKGGHFGEAQDESYVSFGGILPTSTSYKSWSNNEIIVRIPDFGESCMISVFRAGRQGPALLFSSRDSIPTLTQGESILPVIAAIEPAQTQTGRLINIKGAGFGAAHEGAGVEFENLFTAAEENAGIYELWGERQIKMRVPDGAESGSVRVRTEKGVSNAIPVDITRNGGTKIIKDKKTYAISYSVDIRTDKTTLPNFLFLWMPSPINCSWQKKKELIERSEEPFTNYRDITLYRFVDIPDGFSRKVTVSYLIEVFAVETEIDWQKISPYTENPVTKLALASTKLIDANGVRDAAAAIVGRETNPYIKARAIYRSMSASAGGVYEKALRFCALCRAAGVPAQPVAGVLIKSGQQTTPHTWAVFWLEDFGWVPVDFNADSFGNLDNSRIAFSFGETELLPMDSSSKTSGMAERYALQNIWEESSSGLKSYSSFWSEIAIMGVY